MHETIQKKSASHPKQLQKCPTGIKGFDQITEGGLPKNRTTLVSGSAGSGKTLLGLDFLIHGAVNYKERGVFMSFEETEEELYKDCLLYTSDAADDLLCVDLGGRRIIK